MPALLIWVIDGLTTPALLAVTSTKLRHDRGAVSPDGVHVVPSAVQIFPPSHTALRNRSSSVCSVMLAPISGAGGSKPVVSSTAVGAIATNEKATCTPPEPSGVPVYADTPMAGCAQMVGPQSESFATTYCVVVGP